MVNQKYNKFEKIEIQQYEKAINIIYYVYEY